VFPVTTFQGRVVGVFGLARTGIAACLALQAGGARVLAWDDAEAGRNAARAAGVEPVDLNGVDFAELAALVMSPGVPLYGPKRHWSVARAEAVGVPVIGDVELFARELAALPEAYRPKVVGVTGTNGKSTTTALIAHILAECGRDVRMGGNIGVGVLALAPPRPGAVYVLELSSYQLDLTTSLRCNAAVHLNLSPDHLERHGTMARYAQAKRAIFANQGPRDWAIVGVDDDWGEALCTRLNAANGRVVVPVASGQSLGRGVCALGPMLWDSLDGRTTLACDLSHAAGLPGAHNGQNAAAAFAAARALGLPADAIAAAILSFPGLAHRLQEVGRVGLVRFFDDSKATNADAAARALTAFETVHWIAGGQAKTDGIDPLVPLFDRLAGAYLIGEAQERFAATLKAHAPHVPVRLCGTMEAAVRAAHADAEATGEPAIVALSPAAASFDQYPDFEARGAHFTALVQALVKHHEGLSDTAA
jgi:UDP-N-acetylmuramoylalanine--D-glutamate ligase